MVERGIEDSWFLQLINVKFFCDIHWYIFCLKPNRIEPSRTDGILKNLESNRNRLGSVRFGSVRFETEPIPSLVYAHSIRNKTNIYTSNETHQLPEHWCKAFLSHFSYFFDDFIAYVRHAYALSSGLWALPSEWPAFIFFLPLP